MYLIGCGVYYSEIEIVFHWAKYNILKKIIGKENRYVTRMFTNIKTNASAICGWYTYNQSLILAYRPLKYLQLYLQQAIAAIGQNY